MGVGSDRWRWVGGQERFPNRPMEELQVAAAEQQKITELRMEKMLHSPAVSSGVGNSAPDVPTAIATNAASAQSHGLSGEL